MVFFFNRGNYSQIMHVHMMFHSKSSILGYFHSREQPYVMTTFGTECWIWGFLALETFTRRQGATCWIRRQAAVTTNLAGNWVTPGQNIKTNHCRCVPFFHENPHLLMIKPPFFPHLLMIKPPFFLTEIPISCTACVRLPWSRASGHRGRPGRRGGDRRKAPRSPLEEPLSFGAGG